MYPLIIHNLFGFFIKYVALEPMALELSGIESVRKQILVLLALLQVLFVIITFLLSIFVSHRIAGPIYKLTRYFEEANTVGHLRRKLFFRKHDHFQEVASGYNQMLDGVRQIFNQNVSGIKDSISHVERAIGASNGVAKQELEKALESLRLLEKTNAEPINDADPSDAGPSLP